MSRASICDGPTARTSLGWVCGRVGAGHAGTASQGGVTSVGRIGDRGRTKSTPWAAIMVPMTNPYEPTNNSQGFSPYGNEGHGTYNDPRMNYAQPGPGQPNSYNPYGAGFYGNPYAMVPTAPRKEPVLSLLVSFFLPGVGSMINGDVGRGVGILILYGVGLLLSVVLVGLPLVLAAWVWGLVDAYQGAVAYNRQQGYPG